MRYVVTTFKVRLEVDESGIRMRNSETAAIVARGIFNRLDADKEHFVVMWTNNKNRINGYKEVSTGTLTSSLVTPAEVFLAALRLRAAAIVCVHNHRPEIQCQARKTMRLRAELERAVRFLPFTCWITSSWEANDSTVSRIGGYYEGLHPRIKK